MSKNLNALVIGGGIIGTSVARELQANGMKVQLIEKNTTGEGCSFANAGWVTPCFAMPLPQPGMFWKSIGWLLDPESPLHIHPQISLNLARWLFHFMCSMSNKKMQASIEALVALSKYSLDFYKGLSENTEHPLDFQKKGLLMVSSTASGLKDAETEMKLMAQRNIPGRFLNQKEVLEFEPALKSKILGGVFFPNEAQCEPFQAVKAIEAQFQSLGGVVHPHTEVYDFILKDQKIQEVLTTQGRFSADLIVFASGSWTPAIAQKLKLSIPILGGKGYSMSLSDVDVKPKHPIMIIEKKIAVTPRENSVRLAGTLELVNQDFSISTTRAHAIHKGALEFLNLGEKSTPKELWRGLRPCTPDGVPLIGFSKKIKNLFYCTGHQMLGLQSAPGSARLASDLVFNKNPLTDPHPFRPERFE